MPRELKPKKWPHFMEKKHKNKDQIYHSKKILGKLYDQVERVDFVPDFEAPFNERILQAYELDTKMLQDAADLKSEYDEAMHRVMAQHQIETEFEIWSTLVLHHAREKGDFKFHEIVGEIANTLKSRFREACYEKAGGKTFEQIGPFVAAMYTVTSDQLSQALKECEQVEFVGGQEKPKRKMIASNMPFMSFPWLFHGILGKIAAGSAGWLIKDESVATTASQEIKKPLFKKNHPQPSLSETVDDLVTADGITHRGDVLELFEDLFDYEREPKSAVRRSLSNHDSGNTSSPTTRASVDDILLGDSKGGFLNEVNPSQISKDHHIEFKSDTLMDQPIGIGRDPSIQVGHVSSLVKARSSNEDKVEEDKSNSESDPEEEIVQLTPGRNVMDYLAEYGDDSMTP